MNLFPLLCKVYGHKYYVKDMNLNMIFMVLHAKLTLTRVYDPALGSCVFFWSFTAAGALV